jgi:hypothetical protein
MTENASIQNSFEQAYKTALDLVISSLSKTPDPLILCQNSGAAYQIGKSGQMLKLTFLGQIYLISFPEFIVHQLNQVESVKLTDQLLILHYLLTSKGTPPSGKMISFQEFKVGAAYYPSFFLRAIKPLFDHIGETPEILLVKAAEMGGKKNNLGDYSIDIPAFPRIFLTYVIRKGDEEFPASANILFDTTVLDYLPLEDIVILCQSITSRLINKNSL